MTNPFPARKSWRECVASSAGEPYRIEEGAEADLAEALEFYREESETLAGRHRAGGQQIA